MLLHAKLKDRGIVKVKKLIPAVAFILLGVIAGCSAKVVETQVTSFQGDRSQARGRIYVETIAPESGSSLEDLEYKRKILLKLEAAGYTPTEDSKTADFVAFVSYGIDAGKEVLVSSPVFGSTGGGTTHSSGTVSGDLGSTTWSGTSYTMPKFGIVGSETESETMYRRQIAMDIVSAESLDSDQISKQYEIRAISRGSSSMLVMVFDEMLEAIFQDFPGEHGKARSIETIFLE